MAHLGIVPTTHVLACTSILALSLCLSLLARVACSRWTAGASEHVRTVESHGHGLDQEAGSDAIYYVYPELLHISVSRPSTTAMRCHAMPCYARQPGSALLVTLSH
jgi:hypothetical protein